MCDPLTFRCHVYPRLLLFVELIQRQLNRTDGVEQIAVALQTALVVTVVLSVLMSRRSSSSHTYLRTVLALIRTVLPMVL